MGSAAFQLALLLGPKKRDAIRIVTRCKTVEQFVAVFHRYCKRGSCFVPSADTRPIGTETTFSIRLEDGRRLIGGACIVRGAWVTPDNPYGRPGVELEIVKLEDDSAELYSQLLDYGTPTVQMPAIVVERTPGADFVLPANPLADMDDAAIAALLDCTVIAEDEELPAENVLGIPRLVLDTSQIRAVERGEADPRSVSTAEPTARIPSDADRTIRVTRAPASTLLGIAPLTRADGGPTLVISPVPAVSPTPAPEPVTCEATQPFTSRTNLAAVREEDAIRVLATWAGEPPARPRVRMPPLRALHVARVRAVTTLSTEERLWFGLSLGLALITLGVILASSLASLS